MDKEGDFEKKLENLNYNIEVANKERELAEIKKAEKEAKKSEGSNWKKVLGIAGKFKPNQEVLQTLHGIGFETLREAGYPRRKR